LAARRLTESRETGAQVMVTTCPHALQHLNDVSKRGGGSMATIDLAELAAEHL
jgi:Fe-S oxidoreductase